MTTGGSGEDGSMRITSVTLLAILTLSPAGNQAWARTWVFRGSVPFDFMVGRQTLPAATYTVEVLLSDARSREITAVVVLKTSDDRVYQATVTSLEPDPGQARAVISKLFFTSFAGKRYLNRMWVARDKVSLHFVHTAGSDSAQGTGRTMEVALATVR
jgi:hypothetical protein